MTFESDIKMKKIVVTGGAGLIGIEVCKQLIGRGYKVCLFDLGEQIERVRSVLPKEVMLYYGSVLDCSGLRQALRNCEIIIHLAAILGVHRSEKYRLQCIEINIEGTKNVLDCAVQCGVKKIVFASSSEVYGEPFENPITEETITQGKTLYAITKLAGEELCKAYAQLYPIKFTVLRYFNCYGQCQTAQFVISKFIRNVMSDLPPKIYGDGKQIRSYTYVSDTANATILAAFSKKTNSEIINVGNGDQPISLINLAELIIKLSGKSDKITPATLNDFNGADRHECREIFSRYCNATKVKKLLNWTPRVSLEEGLKDVINTGIIFEGWVNVYDEEM
jgi:UDP-glucose 4-epimerase